MARISLDPPSSLTYRLGAIYARRRFGATLDPLPALAHNPKVLRTDMRAEMSVARWNRVPKPLKNLAEMAAAASVGCSWCLDFGYWVSVQEGMDERKVRAVPHWRDSDLFSDLERAVLGYAEAMSTTPVTVTDEMVEALREHLDESQLVELSMIIAVENQRGRFNSALGLTSQGFKDRCDLAAS
jgi:alkylhydroperoxidase family enzyme